MNRLLRAGLIACAPAAVLLAAPVELGTRLEPFVDSTLIDRLENTRLVLGRPQPRDVALTFDEPWEQAANYVTVIKDGSLYRMYYRGCSLTPDGGFDSATEVTGRNPASASMSFRAAGTTTSSWAPIPGASRTISRRSLTTDPASRPPSATRRSAESTTTDPNPRAGPSPPRRPAGSSAMSRRTG